MSEPRDDPALERFAALTRAALNVPFALVALSGERPAARGYAEMPLTDAKGETVGVLYAADHHPRDWTDAELGLLADMAAACSDTLRLRAVADEAERAGTGAAEAEQRLRVLLQANVALAGTRTVHDVVVAVGRLVGGVLEPADIGIAVFGDDRHLSLITDPPLPPETAHLWSVFARAASRPAAIAARQGRPLVLATPAAIAAAVPGAGPLGWSAVACVPLPGSAGPLGMLTFAWRRPHEVDLGEQAVISTIAGYVVQALQRADHLDRQHTAAAVLQRALLTDLPPIPGLRLSARYLPAHHGDLVGGDWYDAIDLGAGRTTLIIGDVSGHSLAAAAGMSELRSMLRGYVVDDPGRSPSAIMERLDRASAALGADTVATALLAVLEPDPDGGHRLDWSSAGHPPPLVVHPGERPRLLDGVDILLGIAPERPRTGRRHHLPPGSTLLLYTDGLIETRGEVIDAGFARLHDHVAAALAEDPGLGPDRLAEWLLAGLDAARLQDDVALLIARTDD